MLRRKSHYELEQVDIFVLVDTTASMLIGATYEEATKMRMKSAASLLVIIQPIAANSYEHALNLGYKLRFSTVADAVGKRWPLASTDDRSTGSYLSNRPV